MNRKVIMSTIFVLLMSNIYAQSALKAIIKDKEDKSVLPGATAALNRTSKGSVSDENGFVILSDVPDGLQAVSFSYVGYKSETKSYHFPLSSADTVVVYLAPVEEMLEEVVVQSTRSTRTIRNIPTRIEFMSSEELGEKASMNPGDIRMLLSESTGISTQQTSAISGNAAIRIQGLDGRYTQILKDGFPAFADAANGLGLLQTTPLDLKQVEVIKGSTSTLYGGGAIAGLINLISKTPGEKRELSLILNGTTATGLDAGVFLGQRFNKAGTTIFASYNRNEGYDPSDAGFTAIPKFERYTFNPKLFLYFSGKTQLSMGLNTAFENRLGGDIAYVKGRGDAVHSYFERNKTQRHSVQLVFNHRFNEQSRLELKSSGTYYNRDIKMPAYHFQGSEVSTFHELSFMQGRKSAEWIAGLNLWTDHFKEERFTDFPGRNYTQNTLGAFIQNNWEVTKWFGVETGLRADYVFHIGCAVLPRLSAHFKITDKLSSRLGGGLGYKNPTIFTEDSERLQYKGLLPLDSSRNKLERSYGLNWDINYATSFWDDRLSFSVNQLLFYTYLKSPLLLQPAGGGLYQMGNISGHIDTKGGETNVKIGYQDFHLYLGYTFTDARTKEGANRYANKLVPRHRVNAILMYELEDKWRIGLESYYFSPQELNDGTRGKAYTTCGFMVEKMWEKFSLYANLENFTDRRQTRFDTIYTGSISNPVFRDIYAPLDGFVMNAGIKLRL